jgi:ATP-dependent protease ClpP protease subunit
LPRRFWEFRAAADEPKTGELLLYGPIGADDGLGWLFDDVTPRDFHADLTALGDITDLKVMINSPGGDVFAGQAIHSMLVRHPANVTVYVDGLAASIASIVAMAGDTVVMPKNAMMMVHNPWTVALGDAREFRKLAETLDSIRDAMIAAYESKTGKTRAELLPLLNAETWMTADEAVALGFADHVEEKKKVAASLVRPGVLAIGGREFDLGHFKNAPQFPDPPRDAGKGKPTKRDVEDALRDAGFSRRDVKTALADGWREPLREAAEADGQATKARLRFDTERLLARVARIGVPA